MKLHKVKMTVCEACLSGIGEVCKTPGCALNGNASPTRKIKRYEVLSSKKASGGNYVDRFNEDKPPAKQIQKHDNKDGVWGAVCTVFSVTPKSQRDRSRIGKVVSEFREKHATSEEIKTRAQRYRQAWPNAAFTPEALAKHWDYFAKEQVNGTGGQGRNGQRIRERDFSKVGVDGKADANSRQRSSTDSGNTGGSRQDRS